MIYVVGLLLPEESKQAPDPERLGAAAGDRRRADGLTRLRGGAAPPAPRLAIRAIAGPDPGRIHGPVPFLLATGTWCRVG